MKQLPRLLYRSPGTHVMPGLNAPTYDYVGVSTPEDYEHRLANGWSATRDEAIGKTGAAKVIDAAEALQDAVDDVSEPTRDELEAKAKELHIGFNWKTTDKVLAEKIAAKI